MTHFTYRPLILLSALLLSLFSVTRGYAQISGRCLDAQTGEGISQVQIEMSGKLMTTSDASGFFEIAEKDRNIQALFYHPEYKTTSQHLLPGADNLVLLMPTFRELGEVTVAAPLLVSKRKAVPGSITLLVADTLNSPATPAEMLTRAPGVIMQQGALNTGRIMIRGIGSRSPYSTTRIRAYLDDIPLTTGDGNTTIEDLEMFDLARIEIIRGPASALYGSGLGGAIIFHPDHTVAGPAELKAMLQKGPFDLTKGAVGGGLKSSRSVLKTTASYTQTDGFRENSQYRRFNGSVMYRTHFKSHALYISGNYIGLNAQIPSSLNEDTYLKTPKKAAANWLAIKGYEKYNKWLSGLTLKSEISTTFQNKAILYLSHNDGYESRPFNILDDRSLTLGLRDELTLKTKKLSVTAGGEIFNEDYNWRQIETLNGREGALEAHNREDRRFINLFGKADWTFQTNWLLSVGGNLHLLKYTLTDILDDETDQTGKYSYNPIFSPRVGINGALGSHMNLFAAAGHGFSVPNVEETLLPEGTINPHLKPEEGINAEIGLRGTALRKHLTYNVTAYHIRVKNLLVTKRESEAIFYGINAGKTRHTGLEIELNGQWPLSQNERSALEIDLAHTLMSNRFKDFTDDGHDYSENRLPGIPNQHTRLAVTAIINHRFSGQAEWTQTGNQYLNDANTVKYNGYNLFHLKTSYTINKGTRWSWQLQAGINNLLDTHYASMVLVNAPSFGGQAPRYYYPGMPRNGYVRLIIKMGYLIISRKVLSLRNEISGRPNGI